MKHCEELERERRSLAAMAYYNALENWAYGKEYDDETLSEAIKVLDKLCLDYYSNEFVVTISKGDVFYRGRKIEASDCGCPENGIIYDEEKKMFRGFNAKESGEPPKEKSKAGRLSREGESALYLAEDPITACIECGTQMRQMVSLARYKVDKDIEIIDFSKLEYKESFAKYDEECKVDVRQFLSYICALFTYYVYEDKEYIFTQKLADHFREKGFNGFAYRSFHTNKRNYTFFDEDRKKFNWLDSNILLNYASANHFMSLDDEKGDLENRNILDKTIEEKVREKIISNTKSMIVKKQPEK